MNKKILIIGFLDGFANSYKPLEIKNYLTKRGHEVQIIDTQFMSRLTTNKDSFLFYLPSYKILNFLVYVIEATSYLQRKFFSITRKHTYYYLLRTLLELRRRILINKLKNLDYDLLICESQYDSGIFLDKLQKISLYDCATPWADELFYGNELTQKHYSKFKKLEIKIYSNANYLAFHWESYGQYIKRFYKYKKNNIIKLNKGCRIKSKQANFNRKPKILYLGYLGGYWINLPLLSRLSQKYPIDVYGAPKPDKKYRLNYKGYSDPNIISKYQFGLITITNDQLRKNGFSAKHLDYISYGLPVLIPEWRANAAQIGGTILFNEDNFQKKIEYYSKKKNWESISRNAKIYSKKISWEKVLKPLDKILE